MCSECSPLLGLPVKNVEFLIPKLFEYFFNVGLIPDFHIICNAEFVSDAICNF